MFKERIKAFREERNWTQSELARRLGVSHTVIQGYELGTRKPSNDMLCALADLFGCTTDYLLGRTEKS